MALSIRQIHPVFVGEVSGIDLDQAARPRGRGGHRGRHGPLCRARLPRPAPHRRAADGVHAQFRRDRECRRQQHHQARRAAPAGRHERRLEPRPEQQAAGARRPPPHVQSRQPALAFGQLVPRHSGQVLDAVGAHRCDQGRQHRVRRHARGLRCARRRDEGRGRGSRLRALADLFARLARLHRADRGGEGDVQAGAPAARAHASRSPGRKSLYLSSHIGTIVGRPMPEARALDPRSRRARHSAASSSTSTTGGNTISSSGTTGRPCIACAASTRPSRATCAARRWPAMLRPWSSRQPETRCGLTSGIYTVEP